MYSKKKIYHEVLFVSIEEYRLVKANFEAHPNAIPCRVCAMGDERVHIWPSFDPSKMRLFVTVED